MRQKGKVSNNNALVAGQRDPFDTLAYDAFFVLSMESLGFILIDGGQFWILLGSFTSLVHLKMIYIVTYYLFKKILLLLFFYKHHNLTRMNKIRVKASNQLAKPLQWYYSGCKVWSNRLLLSMNHKCCHVWTKNHAKL